MQNQAVTALLSALLVFSLISSSAAEEAWLQEFEDITSRTEESSTMGKDELTTIIDRCDKLKSTIEKSENPQKNVYLFRLDKAKKLFLFVLESDGQ